MKFMTIICLLFLALQVSAKETRSVSGDASFLQSFQQKAIYLKSQRMAEAISFANAVDKIKLICLGDDFKILNEEVIKDNGGGFASVTTTLLVECKNPFPVVNHGL